MTNCYGGYSSGYGTNNSSWDYHTNYITYSPSVNSTTYRITDSESVLKNEGTGTNPDGTVANLGVYGGTYSWDLEDDIFYIIELKNKTKVDCIYYNSLFTLIFIK